MRRFACSICASVGLVVFGACSSTGPVPAMAQVHFVLDAPLCSSTIPVAFLIDGVVVGNDTFRVHLTPSHTESQAFSVPAGNHVLGARTVGAFSHVWRDTVVTSTSGAIAVDSLPLYCS
ncbi:MAG: hypothetical protein ABJB74_00080 [Gemmatimonas sp.]